MAVFAEVAAGFLALDPFEDIHFPEAVRIDTVNFHVPIPPLRLRSIGARAGQRSSRAA